MTKGIDHTLESLEDLNIIIDRVIELVKGGLTLPKMGKVIELINASSDFIADLDDCLPELMDLDAGEAGRLTTKCYEIVKNAISKARG